MLCVLALMVWPSALLSFHIPMGVIDISQKVWFGFSSYSSGTYFFKIRVASYLTIGDYPLIQVGAGILDVPEAAIHILNTILLSAPKYLYEDDQIPYITGSGLYDIPEDIKFDKANAPIVVNPTDYTALSVIPWSVPSFIEATLEYIPVATAYSVIPGSIPGYEDPEAVGVDGAIFMPLKTNYWLSDEIVASQKSSSPEYSRGYFEFAFAYEGQDLPPLHVWVLAPTFEVVYTTYPYRQRDYGGWITEAKGSAYGFIFYYDSLPGYYLCKTDVWKDNNKPAVYYPTRTDPSGGGGPPVNILGIILFLQGLLGFGVKIEEGG